MEVERDVKPQPAGDSEATWSPGPRTTTKIPHFSDSALKDLADDNETYEDLDLQQVSDSIDSLFGKLPDSGQKATKPVIVKASGGFGLGLLNRASGAVTGKLAFFRGTTP